MASSTCGILSSATLGFCHVPMLRVKSHFSSLLFLPFFQVLVAQYRSFSPLPPLHIGEK